MGGRRRLAGVIGLSLLALLGAGSATARLHEVEGAAPFNGQVVRPDLSDEGLDGAVRVNVRIPARFRRGLRDPSGQWDGNGPAVSLLDQGFRSVLESARYRSRTRELVIHPTLPLPEGQYTLTLWKGLLGKPGILDGLIGDFRTSFTVGPDVYPPVIQLTEPAANQTEVPRFTPVVVSFNESLDPASVVLGKTVFVEDAGAEPPRPVEGTLLLREGGFDLVFAPDPCFGLPPGTAVRVRLLGAGNGQAVADRKGNALPWDYSFGFRTAGETLPDPLLVPPPAMAFYATTADSVAAFDIRDAFAEDGSVHPGRVRQVTAANGYGGDFRARLGRPGDAVLDPRADPVTGQSSIYIVDEAANNVAVIGTDNGRVGARTRGFKAPRGLGIATRGNLPGTASLFITDAGQGTLTLMSLDMPPALPTCAIEVYLEPSVRTTVATPGTPGAVAAGAFPGATLAMVALPVLNETTVFGVGDSGALSTSYGETNPVGENPTGLAWAGPTLEGHHVCWVTCEGGPLGTGGWVGILTDYRPQFWSEPWTVTASTKEIREPGKPCAVPGTLRCLVPDRASGSLVELETVLSGSFVMKAIVLVRDRTIDVGGIPSSVATDPTGRLAFVSLVGEGAVAVIDLADPAPVPFKLPLPGVRSVFSTVTQ
jgi:hypothetical protein